MMLPYYGMESNHYIQNQFHFDVTDDQKCNMTGWNNDICSHLSSETETFHTLPILNSSACACVVSLVWYSSVCINTITVKMSHSTLLIRKHCWNLCGGFDNLSVLWTLAKKSTVRIRVDVEHSHLVCWIASANL